MTNIVPLSQIGHRMVEHGRIRLGVKTGRSMKSIDTFRFTSPDRTAIEQLAALYGGDARPWHDDKASPQNQFEVISKANRIPVWILPGQLDQNYEMWSGGGCVRRCDGEMCETSQRTYDADYEAVMVPCLCDEAGKLSCSLHTRLSVILPEVKFGGSWRVETKGRNAAEEMPAMAELLEQLQARGILHAELSLEKRQSQGGRRKFVVPVITPTVTANELVAGAGQVSALNTGTARPALGSGVPATSESTPPAQGPAVPGPGAPPPWEPDTEVADAEIVEDEPPRGCAWCGHAPGTHVWADPPNSSDAGIVCTECPDGMCLQESIYQMEHAPREPVELTPKQIGGLLDGSAKWSVRDAGKVVRAR